MPYSIKVCHLEQLPLLTELSQSTYRDTFSASNSEALMQSYFNSSLNEETLARELQNPDSEFYFIYVQQQVAGFIKINQLKAQTDIHDPRGLEVERLYIRQSFFGLGLGRALIEFAINQATSNQHFLWLGVWEGNHHALAFYQRLGFYQIGEHPFDMGGDIQTDLLMRLDIR